MESTETPIIAYSSRVLVVAITERDWDAWYITIQADDGKLLTFGPYPEKPVFVKGQVIKLRLEGPCPA